MRVISSFMIFNKFKYAFHSGYNKLRFDGALSSKNRNKPFPSSQLINQIIYEGFDFGSKMPRIKKQSGCFPLTKHHMPWMLSSH